ncbi:TRAP transporter small permease [Paracandidimonas soli]|uniref:TRAP transporter small permease protein n=1 Tax=Paracandidimonas soli TaxID=1917182 RepID=A0A4R3VAW3_9BURK|nr:TRAP transporter small permease [Paracandidimonas soli]TCV00732.1 TRAP-type C4-dicarboxylate transport system permease small subunit [Paracandidimonas soli]
MKLIQHIERWLRRILLAISMLTTAFLVVLIPLNIAVRALSGQGWGASVQIVELAMVIIIFFALAEAEARKEHVDVSLFTNMLGTRTRAVVRFFERLLYAAFATLLGYYTLLRAIRSFERDETMWAGVSVILQWPFRFILPIGLAALLLTIIVHHFKESS